MLCVCVHTDVDVWSHEGLTASSHCPLDWTAARGTKPRPCLTWTSSAMRCVCSVIRWHSLRSLHINDCLKVLEVEHTPKSFTEYSIFSMSSKGRIAYPGFLYVCCLCTPRLPTSGSVCATLKQGIWYIISLLFCTKRLIVCSLPQLNTLFVLFFNVLGKKLLKLLFS